MHPGSAFPTHIRVTSPLATPDARLMARVAIFFAFAVLVHNADHLRRGGDAVSAQVFWLGSGAIILEVGLVALVFMRHAAVPLAAAIGGFALASGYVFVHFTPARGWLSDSFLSGGASPISWTAASLETIAALTLSVAGAVVLQRRRSSAAHRRPVDSAGLRETLRHPVVGVMAVGNVLIFMLSFVERYA